jgi:hypothetical protein
MILPVNPKLINPKPANPKLANPNPVYLPRVSGSPQRGVES